MFFAMNKLRLRGVPLYAFGYPTPRQSLGVAQFVHSESIFPIPENWGCKKTYFFTAPLHFTF